MPDYRKFHQSAGHSEKVSTLTDFEFRVWYQMRQSADDFGVGPMIPGKLQGDNRALAHRPTQVVRKAMERVIAVGLAETFDHQGQAFYFQRNWQDYEDIRYPRRSVYPYPPNDRVSDKTQELIREAEETFSRKRRKDSAPTERYAGAGARVQPVTVQPDQPVPALEESRETKPRRGAVLVTSPLEWDRKHGAVHVTEFCDWVCFPNDLHEEFARKVPGDRESSKQQVLDWARQIREAWRDRIVPDGSPWDFWKHQWTATHGGSKPTSPTGDGLDGLRKVVRNG